MNKGKVKFFNDASGFGFITDEQGNEVFVHYSDIISDGFKTLAEDQEVEFELYEENNGKRRAKNVKEGGKTMREIIRLSGDEIQVGGLKYYVTGMAAIEFDKDYGSDRDGNRGTPVHYMDEYELFICNEDGEYLDTYKKQEPVLEYLEENWEKFV